MAGKHCVVLYKEKLFLCNMSYDNNKGIPFLVYNDLNGIG